MIDTIIIRIQNLHKYPSILKTLRKENEGQAFYDVENPHEKEVVDRETGEICKDQYLQVKEIRYEDNGKRLTLYKNKVLTSSHYYLGYRISPDRNFAEFNFSIPKYCFGTNLLQFVTHKYDKPEDVTMEEMSSMEYNVENTFPKLIQFIKEFKETELPGINIDNSDLEIVRLDLCYNQIFQSKEDALQYLDYQKKIKKKYLKETSKNKVDWGTSIFITTERYAAKIYHKGSEYKSSNGEKKHHLRMNKELGYDHFSVEQQKDEKGNILEEGFQSFADRILRYEISFKNAYMSHLFKTHLFCTECETLSMIKKDNDYVKGYRRKINYLESKDNLSNDEIDQLATLNKEYRAISRYQKENSRLYDNLMNNRNSFRLSISLLDQQANKYLKYCNKDNEGRIKPPKLAVFSSMLLEKMFDVFNDFMNQFEIKSLDKFTDVTKRVIAYNQKVKEYNENLHKAAQKHKKSQLNENHINSILLHLQKHSFDELVDLKVISRRTKYNYIKALEKIGLSKNHLAIDSVEIEKSEDFKEYHQHINVSINHQIRY